jgi:hypothetical protein
MLATVLQWRVTGLSWAMVERKALGIATMVLRPVEVWVGGCAWDLVDQGVSPATQSLATCGVGTLAGPGTLAIAGGFSKSFTIGEKIHVKLQSTFSNLHNHDNFAPPSTDVTSSRIGQVTSVRSSENAENRSGQIVLRFEFCRLPFRRKNRGRVPSLRR